MWGSQAVHAQPGAVTSSAATSTATSAGPWWAAAWSTSARAMAVVAVRGPHHPHQLARTQLDRDRDIGQRSKLLQSGSSFGCGLRPVHRQFGGEGEGAVGRRQHHEVVVAGSSLPQPHAGLADPPHRFGQMRTLVSLSPDLLGVRHGGNLGKGGQ